MEPAANTMCMCVHSRSLSMCTSNKSTGQHVAAMNVNNNNNNNQIESIAANNISKWCLFVSILSIWINKYVQINNVIIGGFGFFCEKTKERKKNWDGSAHNIVISHFIFLYMNDFQALIISKYWTIERARTSIAIANNGFAVHRYISMKMCIADQYAMHDHYDWASFSNTFHQFNKFKLFCYFWTQLKVERRRRRLWWWWRGKTITCNLTTFMLLKGNHRFNWTCAINIFELKNGGSLYEQRTTLSLFAWIKLYDSSEKFVVIHIMWHASQSHAYHALAYSHMHKIRMPNHTLPTDCQQLICWIPVFMVPVPVKHSNSHFNPINSK